jgi:hypothetical protein
MESIEDQVLASLESGAPLRLHARDGEVLVVQVIAAGGGRLRCRVLTSSRPENHASCDSPGFELAIGDIERAAPLDPARYRRR